MYTYDRNINFKRGVWSVDITSCHLRDKSFAMGGIGIKNPEKLAVSRKLRLNPFFI